MKTTSCLLIVKWIESILSDSILISIQKKKTLMLHVRVEKKKIDIAKSEFNKQDDIHINKLYFSDRKLRYLIHKSTYSGMSDLILKANIVL